jgi:hypothetical protein
MFFCVTVFAQNPARVTIKGIIQDTSSVGMGGATVMLLTPKDSSLINFSRANDKGVFEFKNVKNANYILKVSYVGYFPYQQLLSPSTSETADLGGVKIKPISKELLEVVVRTAKAPLSIRGDTVEYDASTFKVPPGSTVEDLLRRLPGIQLDADGNIKAQGKDVKNVYVDGKTFFGGDAKAATKNLGAETISKVQVFNEKSEQSKLTGIDDGKKEKSINLELKEEFKKGSFGKMTIAAGTQDRWALRGNYNRFNKKEQMSAIGYGNNINETGVNWDDYGDFKGNSSFNFENDDFGFSSGNRFYYFTDDIGGIPRNSFNGKGFTQNAGSGLNYNYTHKKTKLNTSYFYNQTRLALDQFTNKQTFLKDGSFFNKDTANKADFRGNHRVNFRWEEMVDSSNTIVTKADMRFTNSNVVDDQTQRFFNGNELQNRLKIDNAIISNSFNANASLIFRHKYKLKKGRNFAASIGVGLGGSDGTENLYSINRFLVAKTFTEQVRSQNNINENNSILLKGSLLFVEPFSKRIKLESFYNFTTNNQNVGRGAFNGVNQERRYDSLSTYFTNRITYNRVGTTLRYAHEGINVALGVAAQNNELDGKQALEKGGSITKSINKNFFAITPNLDINIELKNNASLNGGYNYSQNVPQLSDLQPVVNNNNPFFITEGNPNLTPERFHGANLGFYKFDQATFANFNLGMNYKYYESQIIYTQTIDSRFVTRTRPENIGGGQTLSGYTYIGFPIVKTKLTVNLNGNMNFSNTPTFINGVQNETDSKNTYINFGFTFTPGKNKLILDFNHGLGITNIKYSIDQAQNQRLFTQYIRSSLKWNFAKKLFLETNLDYNLSENDRFNFSRKVAIWNASVRRLLTKDNKLEVRLAAFDLLNQNVSIRQNSSINFVSQEIAPTLSRYFMLSLSYNVRGHQDKLKKGNGW